MELDKLDQISAQAFEGYIVRKDLLEQFRKTYPVPTYVIEFLLGRYCATTNEQEIQEGLEIVSRQLKDRTVRPGEEEYFKSTAAQHGLEHSHRRTACFGVGRERASRWAIQVA